MRLYTIMVKQNSLQEDKSILTHSVKGGLYESHLSVALNGIGDKHIKQLFSLIFLLPSRETGLKLHTGS